MTIIIMVCTCMRAKRRATTGKVVPNGTRLLGRSCQTACDYWGDNDKHGGLISGKKGGNQANAKVISTYDLSTGSLPGSKR